MRTGVDGVNGLGQAAGNDERICNRREPSAVGTEAHADHKDIAGPKLLGATTSVRCGCE